MKLGIITFHRAINYGAALQSFALQKALNEMGYDAEVLDYACEYLENHYKKFYNSSGTIKGAISAIIYYPIRSARIRKFREFREHYLKTSKKKNISRSELSRLSEEYDYIITGSDQVWNPEQTECDTTYFLDFVDPMKKVSYAASLGTDNPTEMQQRILKTYIQGYEKVSVREKESADYLERLLGIKVHLVVDPVFLLEANDWRRLIANKPLVNKPYIFVYCLHEKTCYYYAEHLADKTGKKIVSIPDSIKTKCSGKKDFKAGVLDFLNYIYYADYVITDSFHATAFSIIFEKRFNIIMKQNRKDLNGRLSSIASRYNLDDVVIWNRQNEDKLGKEVSFADAKIQKEKDIMESKKFIKSIGEKNEN